MNSPFVPIRRRFMALAVLCGLAAPLAADQFGDFTYTSNGSAITITGYTGAGGAVSIPATINSLPVTAIGAYAFQNKTAITSVVVPNGVTGIDTSAFQGSAGLAEARFIGNAPTMGASVFASTAPGFTVYFIESGTGFTTPSWQGFPAVPVDGFYLVNGSFEQGPTISGWGYTVQSPNSITIPGWTVSRNNIDIVVRATWSASNGNRSIDMNGNNIGEMYQDVGGLTPGVSYLLEFDFGGSPHVGGTDPVGDADPIKDLRVAAATTVADFQFDTSPYRMNASGTVPAVGWTRKSVTFTARNATERITFTSMDPASSQRGPLLDNVILTAAPLLRDYGITGYQARIVGNRISWWLPRNMDLGSLAPTFTSPAGASATPPSGTVRDFTAPQSYVLRSADGLVTKTYTVTAVPFSIWGNDSSGLWNTTGQWVNGAVPNGADNMADFGAIDVTADRLVTVDTPVSINRLVFGDAAPVTAGGWMVNHNGNSANVVTLAGTAPMITVNPLGAGKDVTIGATLAGTAGLVKSGSGMLGLTGINSCTGGTIIQEGSLRLGAIGAIAGTGSVINNGSLVLDIPGVVTVNNGISGTGTLLKEGAGIGLLNTPNTFTGGTVINGGTLAVDGNQAENRLSPNSLVTVNNPGSVFEIRGVNALPTNASRINVVVNQGAILRMLSGGSAATTQSHAHLNNITLNGGIVDLTFSGTGSAYSGQSLYLHGNLTAGGTAMSTIRFGSGAATANAGIGLSSNINVITVEDMAVGADLVVNAQFKGGGGYNKTGPGTMVLNFANSYTGVTTISGGTLAVGTINNGGVAGNLGQAASGSANLVLNGGVLSYTGMSSSTDRGMTLNSTAGNGIQITTGSAVLTSSGVLTGAGGFTKYGPGVLYLAGGNTYTGTTTVLEGTLRLGSYTALGAATGGTVVTSGAALELNGRSIGAEPLTLNGPGLGNGGALNGSGTWGGPITLTSGSSVGGSGTTTLSGAISGPGGLTKVGTAARWF